MFRCCIRDGVSSSGDGLLAGLAVPDTSRVALDGSLSAESAGVSGVLGDFHLLHLLTQGSTVTESNVSEHSSPASRRIFRRLCRASMGIANIPGAVFTGDADLLSALGHFCGCV